MTNWKREIDFYRHSSVLGRFLGLGIFWLGHSISFIPVDMKIGELYIITTTSNESDYSISPFMKNVGANEYLEDVWQTLQIKTNIIRKPKE